MKLAKLYSNQPAIFEPIEFNDGLNIVLAEIRQPEIKHKDSHNLGKTLLGTLIDFCLLSKRNKDNFPFSPELFMDFTFFLEVRCNDGRYVTVARSVATASKIRIKRSLTAGQDLTYASDDEWDHLNVPFERAQKILDGYFNLTDMTPWTYRKGLGYLIRSQGDYSDVFQLSKFARGKDSDWKPFMAHILGFESELLVRLYKTESLITKCSQELETLQTQLDDPDADIGRIDGLIALKRGDVKRTSDELAAMDFRSADAANVKALVEEIDEELAELNARRYTLTRTAREIDKTLSDHQVNFDVHSVETLFKEAGVLLGNQIKVDYENLVEFYRAVTDERREYLSSDRQDVESELSGVVARIDALGRRRSESISFITSTDVFDKYKDLSDRLVTLRADQEVLERQRRALESFISKRLALAGHTAERNKLQSELQESVNQTSSSDSAGLFADIRRYFDEIVRSVISHDALLTVSLNNSYHPEFRAEILDSQGHETNAGSGTSYKKLLCITFDLAVLRGHLDGGYARFVYHDGAFETLEPRKRELLLDLMRRYSDLGIQQIVTTLDSDAPEKCDYGFTDEEIVLRLHDIDESGRLFKMRSW